MIELEALQNELLNLPKKERLQIAHWLLDSLVETPLKPLPLTEMVDENPLTGWIGLFSGGLNDTAERAEEILVAEVNPISGFGKP